MSDLTHELVLKMEAGPELDALVAERVMGWETLDREHAGWGKGPVVVGTNDPKRPTIQGWFPSTDIAAAMEVWDTLGADNAGHFLCKASDGWSLMLPKRGEREAIIAGAPTAPLAICRAALLTTLEAKDG